MRLAILLLLTSAISTFSQNARPTLRAIFSPQGVQIVLTNAGPTNYLIEASTDLQTWLPVTGLGARTNASQIFSLTNRSAHSLFYRARGPVRPPLTISPEEDVTQ